MAASEDRFSGCLIGQCVGDAVGFMVEGAPADACRPHADGVLFSGEAFTRTRGPYHLGQYSDDSQLARELVESCVACGRFEPEDYARRIAAIFADGRIVGGGRSTGEAAGRLAAGVPWQEAGTPAPTAGNGSAMRAGPIGLMFHDDPDALVAAARDQGHITHADPRCSAGSVAIAGAVALMVGADHEPVDVPRFADTIAGWAACADAGVADALCALPEIVALAPEEALSRVLEAAQPDFRDLPSGISPFVTTSVLWSLYAFLRSPGDYRRTVHTAVAVGGDVDTTAAMAGAISGARNGFCCVPPALAGLLNDRGQWRLQDLVSLAGRLWHLKCGPGIVYEESRYGRSGE